MPVQQSAAAALAMLQLGFPSGIRSSAVVAEATQLCPPDLINGDSFPSRDALVAHVCNYALQNKFAVTIARSDEKRGLILLKCDRGGTYKRNPKVGDAEKQRDGSGTHLIGCQNACDGGRQQSVAILGSMAGGSRVWR